jgi:hypothetical protein
MNPDKVVHPIRPMTAMEPTPNHSFPPLGRSFVRPLLVCLCGMMLALVSLGRAESADGTYPVQSLSGTIRFLGQRIPIDTKDLHDFGVVQRGAVVINHHTLRLHTSQLDRTLRDLETELGVRMKIIFSGPTDIQLRPRGTSWVGKTTTPVRARFSFPYRGTLVKGELKHSYDITIDSSGTMTIPITLSGSFGIFGGVSGKVTMQLQRNPHPAR